MDFDKSKLVRLKYGQIRDPEFNPTVMKLIQSRMKYRAAKKILTLAKAIRAEQMKSDQVWAELSDKFLEQFVDEEGALKGLQIKATFTDEEKKEAGAALDDFAKTEIVLDREKLAPSDLAGVEITPAELARISALVDDDL